jgi:putative DNA primase/helicase
MQTPVATDPMKIQEIQQLVAAEIQREKEQYCLPPAQETQRIPSEDILRASASGEDGDAALFVQLYDGVLCFDHSAQSWHIFDGHHWSECRLNEPLAMVEGVIGLYEQEARRQAWLRAKAAREKDTEAGNEAAANESRCLKSIQALQRLNRKRAVLELAAAGSDSLGITGDEWDTNPWLLGCANGVVDLKTGDFRSGRPDDMIRAAAPTPWLGLDAPAPTFRRFLPDVFCDNQGLIGFLQRLFGCGIIGQVIEHLFIIFWGIGRNGKGSLLEAIHYALGPFLSGPIQAEMLLEQKWARSSGAPAPDLLALQGKRVTWASETGKGRQLNEGKVKWLSGGDTITGRALYGKHPTTFPASHTLFLLTNHKPRVDPADFALWERAVLVPFTVNFVNKPVKPNERKVDRLLMGKLKTEASGLLAWLVQGCLAYQQEGLNPPELVVAATKEYQKAEDLLAHFIEDCCTIQPGAEVKAGELYEAYCAWCDAMGHKAMSGTAFGGRIKEQYPFEKRGYVYYQGIGLITSASPEQAVT